MKKFEDQGAFLSQFYAYRIVECPKCAKPIDYSGIKLVCINCGYNKEVRSKEAKHNLTPASLNVENFLSISCCGERLWAMNLEHLDFLECYVESELRERIPNINKSLASRLPQWIKSRKNRNEILRGIKKLRNKLKEENYKTKNIESFENYNRIF